MQNESYAGKINLDTMNFFLLKKHINKVIYVIIAILFFGLHMTITTKNCKDFILSIADFIGEDSNEKWNRIKKYNVEPYILRDFENSTGRILTVAEYNDKLFLYTLGEVVSSSNEVNELDEVETLGMYYVGHKATETDLKQFISSCIKINSNIVDTNDYNDAINPSKWRLNWEYVPLEEKDYIIEENYLYYSIDNEYIYNRNCYKRGNIDQFACYIDRTDLYKIHCVSMPDYDTAYRIYIYETNDHYLYLGLNNSD